MEAQANLVLAHLQQQPRTVDAVLSARKVVSTVLKSSVERDPVNLIRGHALKIVDKRGNLVRLVPSYTQTRFLHVVETLWRRKQKVRMHVLKARQVFISTIVEALFYCIASQTENVKGAVIADDDKGSEYLFDMQKRMQEECQREFPFLVEKTRRNRQQLLEWEKRRSWIMTDTARNLRAGRKFTLQMVHLSESAFFQDYDTLTTGLFQAVPDELQTMIVDESTANGMVGGFYDGVMNCYTPSGKWDDELECWVGPDGWVLLFIGWYEHPEYRRLLQASKLETLDGIHFASQQEKDEFTSNEETLRQVILHHHIRRMQKDVVSYSMDALQQLVEEQLNWRRHKIKEDCKGDVKVFDQEYPDSVDTAFIASGKPALNVAVVTKNLKLSRFTKARSTGNFVWLNSWKDERGVLRKGPRIVNDDCTNGDALRVGWLETPQGYWKRWRDVEHGWTNGYCIGADVAEGLEQGDYDAGRILSRIPRLDGNTHFVEVVASFLGHLDTDLFAEELVKAALYYDQATLGIERNNHGLQVIKRVFQMYRRLYWQKDFSKGYPQSTEYVGWLTLEGSKTIMVDTLNEWLRTGQLRDPDLEFWSQARTFVRDKHGKIGAQGKRQDPGVKVYDDAPMAEAVMLQTHIWLPLATKIVPPVTGWRKKVLDKSRPKGADSV